MRRGALAKGARDGDDGDGRREPGGSDTADLGGMICGTHLAITSIVVTEDLPGVGDDLQQPDFEFGQGLESADRLATA